MARDHENGDRGIAALDLLEQLQPVEPRPLKPYVEKHHRRPALLDRIERGGAVRRGPNLVALVFQDSAHELADVGLVVHNQYFKRHQASSPLSEVCCCSAD